MGNKKLQYQAISKNFFVPATVIATVVTPFSQFSQPQRASNPALRSNAVANTPFKPTSVVQPASVFTKFSQPSKSGTSAVVQSATFPTTPIAPPVPQLGNPMGLLLTMLYSSSQTPTLNVFSKFSTPSQTRLPNYLLSSGFSPFPFSTPIVPGNVIGLLVSLTYSFSTTTSIPPFATFGTPSKPPNPALQSDATSAFPFTANPVVPGQAPFAQFLPPQKPVNNAISFSNNPLLGPSQTLQQFADFSFTTPKPFTFGTQPSGLFETRVPDPASSGPVFVKFSLPQRFPTNVTLLVTMKQFPFNPPPSPKPVFVIDTHDGVKKRKKRDVYREEQDRRKRLRQDIEQVINTPVETVYEPLPDWIPPEIQQAPDYSELIKIIVEMRQRQLHEHLLKQQQDEDDDMDFILRNLS